MWSIIREIFTYICFLTVLSVIIYSNRDSNSFFQVNHLRKHFLNQGKTHYDYTKVCFFSFFINNKKYDLDFNNK